MLEREMWYKNKIQLVRLQLEWGFLCSETHEVCAFIYLATQIFINRRNI